MARSGSPILAITALAAVAQVAIGYARLPPRMASHFDAAGAPDAWMSRGAFVTLWLAIIGATCALSYLLPLLVERLPASVVNIPHREHWLAPERRAEAMRILARHMAWMGAGTSVLLMGTWQLVVSANAGRGNLSSSAWWWWIGYLAFVACWLVSLVRAYSIRGARVLA